ncbi:nucleoside permease [Fulvivirgaceae bacterium BMA10]|uniref:Nucleoside permease n=1 Tax=Splendidivirga corallicola TaxID=3051826 RepID=A0ABT8KMS3_9BACT|nr:nucleoside permease [Fulvivirgaceae bacterium BMA10]
MNINTRLQLSSMMFLQFFIWGAWFVTASTYLNSIGFSGIDIGKAYSTMPWGAIISPFFIGMIADKYFSAEKVMGVMHIAGGFIMYYASGITDPNIFFWTVLLYAICYMPTLALVNSISFNQMTDTGKEFPSIRVWGTIGWIGAGLLIGFLDIESTSIPMKIAAGVSMAMGLFSFTLPKTPPKSSDTKVSISNILGLKALSLMREKSFAIFVISSFLISIPLTFYYNFTNLFLNENEIENAAGKMTMGQMSEILFMILMPFFFKRLGVKKMLLVGMMAWVVRYVLFATGNNEALVFMFYLGIILHGICYDFFFVTGQIYVDKKASGDIQASAQGFITLVTYGVGMLLGSWVSGFVVEFFSIGSDETAVHDWPSIWYVPAGMALLITLIFALLFKDNKQVS